jgi:hypothetical protein
MDSRSRLVWTVTVYLFLMAAFIWAKPGVAFGREGRIRPFGTRDKEATVFPLWWWIFVIAVVSYLVVIAANGFRA